MMQSAYLRDGDDITFGRRFRVAWRRRVAIQGQVAAGIVVMVEVTRKDAVQMPLVQRDHVIQALSTY